MSYVSINTKPDLLYLIFTLSSVTRLCQSELFYREDSPTEQKSTVIRLEWWHWKDFWYVVYAVVISVFYNWIIISLASYKNWYTFLWIVLSLFSVLMSFGVFADLNPFILFKTDHCIAISYFILPGTHFYYGKHIMILLP